MSDPSNDADDETAATDEQAAGEPDPAEPAADTRAAAHPAPTAAAEPAAGTSPASPADGHRSPGGSITWGVVLVLMGLAWLLEALGIVELAWSTMLPVALIATGAAIVVAGVRGRPVGALVWVGVVLLVLTLAVRTFGGATVDEMRAFGDFDATPESAADVDDEYGVAMGSLTVDLSELDAEDFEDLDTLEIAVIMGEGVVIVPDDVAVRLDGRVVMGDASVFGKGQAGIVRGDAITSDGFADADAQLAIDASVTMGNLRVVRD